LAEIMCRNRGDEPRSIVALSQPTLAMAAG
jgi:hypothetical protein